MVTLGKSGRCGCGRCSSLIHKFSKWIKSFPLFISAPFPGWGPLPTRLAGTFAVSSGFGMQHPRLCGAERFLLTSAGPSSTPSWQAPSMEGMLPPPFQWKHWRRGSETSAEVLRKQWGEEGNNPWERVKWEQTHRKDEKAPEQHVVSGWVGARWTMTSSVRLSWSCKPLGFVTALERQGSCIF